MKTFGSLDRSTPYVGKNLGVLANLSADLRTMPPGQHPDVMPDWFGGTVDMVVDSRLVADNPSIEWDGSVWDHYVLADMGVFEAWMIILFPCEGSARDVTILFGPAPDGCTPVSPILQDMVVNYFVDTTISKL